MLCEFSVETEDGNGLEVISLDLPIYRQRDFMEDGKEYVKIFLDEENNLNQLIILYRKDRYFIGFVNNFTKTNRDYILGLNKHSIKEQYFLNQFYIAYGGLKTTLENY